MNAPIMSETTKKKLARSTQYTSITNYTDTQHAGTRDDREPRIKSLAHARGAALRIVPTASDPMASSSTGLRLPVGRRTEAATHISLARQFAETHTIYHGKLGKVGVDAA